jgi:hypothetical protein
VPGGTDGPEAYDRKNRPRRPRPSLLSHMNGPISEMQA